MNTELQETQDDINSVTPRANPIIKNLKHNYKINQNYKNTINNMHKDVKDKMQLSKYK